MLREFKTILCPIDFSEPSYHALEYALRFARQSDAGLILIHVLHNPADEFFRPADYTLTWGEAIARARTVLEEAKTKRMDNYERAEMVVEVGDPYEQIVKLASDRKADMIVLSTHGRTGLSHIVMGSVAEKVIRHAPCPVFAVRRHVT